MSKQEFMIIENTSKAMESKPRIRRVKEENFQSHRSTISSQNIEIKFKLILLLQIYCDDGGSEDRPAPILQQKGSFSNEIQNQTLKEC